MGHTVLSQPFIDNLIFGKQADMRLRLQRTLIASSAYSLSLFFQWCSVWSGRTDAFAAMLLTLLTIGGNITFYAMLRLGFTRRAADPAWTMPQMAFGLMIIAIAYRINGQNRAALLMFVGMVLVYGAFILPPHRCRQLGWVAVALLAVAMVSGALQDPGLFDPVIELLNFGLAGIALPTVAVLAGQLSGLRIDQKCQKRALHEAMQRLNELATRDLLTGLPNRRYMHQWVASLPASTRRSADTMSLAVIDLDHFKRVNDTQGHTAGDQALRIFSREARQALRTTDLIARWGGEEFIVVMPDTSTDDASEVLERLRARLLQPEVWAECPLGQVTFSAGLVHVAQTSSLEHAIQVADKKLYEAKQRGRNCTVAA